MLDRYPGWREPLDRSYGGMTVHCLDLWVTQYDGQRSWSFEVFDEAVLEVCFSSLEGTAPRG